MARPSLRMQKQVRRPKGKVLYRLKKPSKASCALCKTALQGVPNKTRSGMRGLSKTQKRPERAFGGILCPRCAVALVKLKARGAKPSVSQSKFFKQLKVN